MDEPNKYCFTSELFNILPGEDEETNPYCFGKELADWVWKHMEGLGYLNSEVIPEDWGWCVSCTSDPYHIFVACGCFVDYEKEYDPQIPPKGSEVIWQCFIGADIPLLRSPFKKFDRSKEVEIEKQLFNLLSTTKEIMQVDEP